MKIVVLDAQTVGEDVDWSGYEKGERCGGNQS